MRYQGSQYRYNKNFSDISEIPEISGISVITIAFHFLKLIKFVLKTKIMAYWYFFPVSLLTNKSEISKISPHLFVSMVI